MHVLQKFTNWAGMTFVSHNMSRRSLNLVGCQSAGRKESVWVPPFTVVDPRFTNELLVTAPLMWLRQQNSLTCRPKRWRDYFHLFISMLRYSEHDDFEDSGGLEALPGSSSSCCGASAVAHSTAIKEQWIVHILYWFVCPNIRANVQMYL